MSKKPTIKVMCDYCATGVWENGGLVFPDEIGLPDYIADDLKKWQAQYETLFNPCEPRPKPESVDEFNKSGELIFHKIKEYLGDRFNYEFFREPYGNMLH